MKNLYWGNTMAVQIVVKEDGVPKDCTDYLCAYVLKEKDLRTAPIVLNKAVTWTDQPAGEGFFTITASESDGLSVKTYFSEIILYKANNTFRKTLSKSKLVVKQSLGLT